jgi:hypothetical protein
VNDFGEAFKAAVEKKGKKDLSRHKLSDLFPPTTKSMTAPFTGREDTAGDRLKAAINGNREENDNGD